MEDWLGSSLAVFIGLTVILTGGAAILTGKAIAETWRAPWQAVFACVGLALAARFLVYALFGGPLLHLPGFLIQFAVITVMALVAYRITRVRKMVSQYPWKYERATLWSWRERRRPV